MKIVPQSATMLAMTPGPLSVIEKAGRTCYKSEDTMDCDACHGTWFTLPGGFLCKNCNDRAEAFIRGILKRGHESVIEHASATFLMVTDRGMTHEIVRHRLCSYSQESTRYCNYGTNGGEINVIQPSDIYDGTTAYQIWRAACDGSEKAYLELLSDGQRPEFARSVLPTCLKTEINVSANFREWRHMLKLRLNNAAGKAHPQIRLLFGQVLDQLMDSPAAVIFQDIDDARDDNQN